MSINIIKISIGLIFSLFSHFILYCSADVPGSKAACEKKYRCETAVEECHGLYIALCTMGGGTPGQPNYSSGNTLAASFCDTAMNIVSCSDAKSSCKQRCSEFKIY